MVKLGLADSVDDGPLVVIKEHETEQAVRAAKNANERRMLKPGAGAQDF